MWSRTHPVGKGDVQAVYNHPDLGGDGGGVLMVHKNGSWKYWATPSDPYPTAYSETLPPTDVLMDMKAMLAAKGIHHGSTTGTPTMDLLLAHGFKPSTLHTDDVKGHDYVNDAGQHLYVAASGPSWAMWSGLPGQSDMLASQASTGESLESYLAKNPGFEAQHPRGPGGKFASKGWVVDTKNDKEGGGTLYINAGGEHLKDTENGETWAHWPKDAWNAEGKFQSGATSAIAAFNLGAGKGKSVEDYLASLPDPDQGAKDWVAGYQEAQAEHPQAPSLHPFKPGDQVLLGLRHHRGLGHALLALEVMLDLLGAGRHHRLGDCGHHSRHVGRHRVDVNHRHRGV